MLARIGRMKTQPYPDAATGDAKLATPFTDKKGYGKRWQFSPRKIDGLIASGLPHLKIGARRVRICIAEADAWMMEQFHTQRRTVR